MSTGEDPLLDDADDPFVSALRRMVADANAEDLVADRTRQRWLRQAAEEEATLAGVVLELAERRAPTLLQTVAGRSHRGRIVAAGSDFVVVRDAQRPPVLVAHTGLASIRPLEFDGQDTSGNRNAPVDATLAATLVLLAAERPRLQIVSLGNEHLFGTLRSAGIDVVTIRLDGPERAVAHLPTAAIVEVVLLDV